MKFLKLVLVLGFSALPAFGVAPKLRCFVSYNFGGIAKPGPTNTLKPSQFYLKLDDATYSYSADLGTSANALNMSIATKTGNPLSSFTGKVIAGETQFLTAGNVILMCTPQ